MLLLHKFVDIFFLYGSISVFSIGLVLDIPPLSKKLLSGSFFKVWQTVSLRAHYAGSSHKNFIIAGTGQVIFPVESKGMRTAIFVTKYVTYPIRRTMTGSLLSEAMN